MTQNLCSVFAGIGGFDLAASWAGITTTQFVELDPFCQKVLTKNFPGVPIHDDIKTFHPERHAFDYIVGGFPCQDISLAGKQNGIRGDRSSLFFEVVRVIEVVNPKGFILENVPAVHKYLPTILEALSKAGYYETFWFNLSAKQLGGCHKRNRWFLLGISPDSYCKYEGRALERFSQERANKDYCNGSEPKERIESQAGVRGESHGFPGRLDRNSVIPLMGIHEAWGTIKIGGANDPKGAKNITKRLKTLGNAVTPQQAYVCWLTMLNIIEARKHA